MVRYCVILQMEHNTNSQTMVLIYTQWPLGILTNLTLNMKQKQEQQL